VIATSGTAAALAEASEAMLIARTPKRILQVVKISRSKGIPGRSGRVLTAEAWAVKKIADKLLKMNNTQRAAFPGIGPRRSEIITGGAQVFAALLERMDLKGFRYSPLGLRDGMLAEMLGNADFRASVHRTMEAERWQGVLQVCRRYGVDPKKMEPEREHAAQLFTQLQPVHDLPPEYKPWLEAAAMMQEVGKFMNHQGHHRHTQYIIANSEIFGFSPEQRAIVAAIARYLGKTRPEPMDRVMRMVPVEEHTHVARAIVLLRLTEALNQDQVSAPVRLRTRIYPKSVVLELHPGRGGAELEAWSLKKEATYFRDVFRRELLVEVV
jgi:exopolyphosphatase / guanosine-5'-triphosphate,3'-diphosphate pyrophosphatase